MTDKDYEGLFIIPEEEDTQELHKVTPDVPKYLLSDDAYNTLKWMGLVLFPATATLVGTVGPAWGMQNVDAVVLTINAVGTFIGAVIGISQLSAMGR